MILDTWSVRQSRLTFTTGLFHWRHFDSWQWMMAEFHLASLVSWPYCACRLTVIAYWDTWIKFRQRYCYYWQLYVSHYDKMVTKCLLRITFPSGTKESFIQVFTPNYFVTCGVEPKILQHAVLGCFCVVFVTLIFHKLLDPTTDHWHSRAIVLNLLESWPPQLNQVVVHEKEDGWSCNYENTCSTWGGAVVFQSDAFYTRQKQSLAEYRQLTCSQWRLSVQPTESDGLWWLKMRICSLNVFFFHSALC